MYEKRRNFLLKKIQGSAQHYPFDTILVSFTQRLPHRLLLRRFSSDADPCSASIRTRWVFLDLPEFNTFWGYIVARICKIKHAPECGIRVWLRYLEEREIGGIWRGKRQLVDGGDDARIGDGPFEVTGRFTPNDPGTR
jgi:hypothetical protein